MTVIGKARELIEEVGHEKAITFSQKKIDDLGTPKSFQDECNISGWETAIDYIKSCGKK